MHIKTGKLGIFDNNTHLDLQPVNENVINSHNFHFQISNFIMYWKTTQMEHGTNFNQKSQYIKMPS